MVRQECSLEGIPWVYYDISLYNWIKGFECNMTRQDKCDSCRMTACKNHMVHCTSGRIVCHKCIAFHKLYLFNGSMMKASGNLPDKTIKMLEEIYNNVENQ